MRKKSKKTKKSKLYLLVIFIGVSVMFYPIIAKIINQISQTDAISKYTDQVAQMDEDDIKEKKDKYEKYNQEIIEDKISRIDLLQNGEPLGYIKIDKIKVYLPIYEGTDRKTLQKGVGHLEKTSLPTKNLAYHSVLVGHTGITSKKLFDDIDKLEKGNFFTVTILDESFKYKVYDKKVVKPSQTKELKVQINKQLVTLVTCTPRYVNTHRLLVMGEIVK